MNEFQKCIKYLTKNLYLTDSSKSNLLNKGNENINQQIQNKLI